MTSNPLLARFSPAVAALAAFEIGSALAEAGIEPEVLELKSQDDDHYPERYPASGDHILGVHIPVRDWKHSDERLRKAEEKRLRKQQKRLNKGA